MVDLLAFAASDTPARWVRPRTAQIDRVELAVTIDLEARSAWGTVRHHCRWIGGAQTTLTFDQHELQISAVTVDGQSTAFALGNDDVRVVIPPGAKSFVVALTFLAREPRKGLYFVAADAQHVAMAWTQGAMEDHAHWFPCFDSPNNFSTYSLAIRHRQTLPAIAGGVYQSAVDEGNGWMVTTYVQDRPHVLYLVNVVVGDLVPVEDPGGAVPVTHWLPRGREACAPAMFRATGFAITALAEFIGVSFPWQRYGHVVVHRFMWGGMENATLTTITDRALITAEQQLREDLDFDSLVIHELVHQWFGDLLTMKSWSDIWLNESFATYLESRITARWRAQRFGENEADVLALELWHHRGAYLEQHGSRYQRPLVTNRWDDAYELFDRVAYEQGSLVLHGLWAWLGEARFHAALRLYTTRHAHALVETADLRQAVEDATGEPADWFFEQWLMRGGHPALTMRWSHDPARGRLSVSIEQAEPSYRLHLSIAIAGSETQRVEVTRRSETFVFAVATAPAWVIADPAGELLIVWDEQHSAAALVALLSDRAAPAHARARAATVAAKLHPSAALKQAIVTAAESTVELLREEALATLGTWLASAELLALYPTAAHERDRRSLATALGRCRGLPQSPAIAEQLVAWADASASGCTAGELLAARGALEQPEATSVLGQRLDRPSWNHRLAVGAVRGLGASGEAPAIEVVLGLLADLAQPEVVQVAALTAAGALAGRHLGDQLRIARAVEPFIDDRRRGATMALRAAAIRAGAAWGVTHLRAAIAAQREREPFGNIRRIAREVLHQLEQAAATTTATANLARRLEDLEKAKATLEARFEAIERRLS
jgi:aminopeptidase N